MLTKTPSHSDDGGLRRFSIPGDVYNASPPRIVFGPGSLAGIVNELIQLSVKRALVISTPGRQEMAAGLAERLGDIAIGFYPKAISQVPIELVEAGHKDAVALGPDCLVAIGGGAAIGLGKGIALHSGLPLVAIPSTYSGSEMTGFCGITIAGVKRMHTSLSMLPRMIIYDSDLTLSLPPQVSADSAMNAMAHCVEALYVKTASPIIALAALEGIRVLSESLPRLTKAPNDPVARADALYGAYLGGAALTGGFALHHGVAHVLGATYGLPHAISHSVALPYVTEYNTDAVPEVMQKIADILGATSAAAGIYDFARSIGSPVRLADYNVTRTDLRQCAEIVLETDNGLNPKEVTRHGVLGILEAAYSGRRPAA
jgi:alcohol dehydrogenase class IV